MGRAAGPPGAGAGKRLGTFLALIFVMSVRGWEDARNSKILQISQKGKKKAGVRLPAQAGLLFTSCSLFAKLDCDDSFSCSLINFLPVLK